MYCEKLHKKDLFKKEYKYVLFCCVILHNEVNFKTDNDDNCCDKKELILVDGFQMTCQNYSLVDHVIFKNDYIMKICIKFVKSQSILENTIFGMY